MVLVFFFHFSFRSNGFGRNVIIFFLGGGGADMSSSVNANNKRRNILVLGKDFVQGLDNTQLMQKKCIQLILLKIIKHFV